MIEWGSEHIPRDVYNAAVNAGKKYGKDAAQSTLITNTLLGIGKYESTWNTHARNESDIENSYGWLQFNRGKNGSTGFGTGYTIEQLFNPQVEADIAAEHIARNLNSGVSLFDSLWPWTNTRIRGLQLAGIVTTPVGVIGGGTNNPTITTPSETNAGLSLPNPLEGFDAVGKFFADIQNNIKRITASGVAVVAITVGLLVMVKGDIRK